MIRKFTLFELIVVIAIIAIIAAVAIPNIIEARKRATRLQEQETIWEVIDGPIGVDIRRAKTPQGWLVLSDSHCTYVPDSDHVWLQPIKPEPKGSK